MDSSGKGVGSVSGGRGRMGQTRKGWCRDVLLASVPAGTEMQAERVQNSRKSIPDLHQGRDLFMRALEGSSSHCCNRYAALQRCAFGMQVVSPLQRCHQNGRSPITANTAIIGANSANDGSGLLLWKVALCFHACPRPPHGPWTRYLLSINPQLRYTVYDLSSVFSNRRQH